MSSSDTKICEGVITVRESGDDTDTQEVLSENIKLAGAELPDKKITAAFLASGLDYKKSIRFKCGHSLFKFFKTNILGKKNRATQILKRSSVYKLFIRILFI